MRETSHAPDECPAGIEPYHLFMFGLGIYALLALAAQTLLQLSGETVEILSQLDDVVCLLFFAHFVINLVRAPRKLDYLKWGWIDLVSSIPMIDVCRAGRVARVIRILRAFRSIRSARYLAKHLALRRAAGAFFGAALLSILLVIFSSIAILQFETDAASNIRTPQDAIWWAFTTITTVGYGDRFPVTIEGRMIAGILMIAGVGLFGTFTALIASWIIAPTRTTTEDHSTLQQMRADVREIRERVTDLHGHLSRGAEGDSDPALSRLVAHWPRLPAEARTELLARLSRELRDAA